MIKNKIWEFNNYGKKERNEIGKKIHKKKNKLLCREIKKDYWWFDERSDRDSIFHFKLNNNGIFDKEKWDKYCINLEIERIKIICNRMIIKEIHNFKRVRLHKSYKSIWGLRKFKRELKEEIKKHKLF
jgi:hypothetical protein